MAESVEARDVIAEQLDGTVRPAASVNFLESAADGILAALASAGFCVIRTDDTTMQKAAAAMIWANNQYVAGEAYEEYWTRQLAAALAVLRGDPQ